MNNNNSEYPQERINSDSHEEEEYLITNDRNHS